MKHLHTFGRHKAQVTACEISDDGLLGITGSQDKTVILWNLQAGSLLRVIKVSSYVVSCSLTAMAKFLAVNLLDGTLILYETITGITWRSEQF